MLKLYYNKILHVLTAGLPVHTHKHNRFTTLFRDHLAEPVPEGIFWTFKAKFHYVSWFEAGLEMKFGLSSSLLAAN